MTDYEIYLDIENYINQNNLKTVPIDESFPMISEYTRTLGESLGRDGKELFNLYFDIRSEVILGHP